MNMRYTLFTHIMIMSYTLCTHIMIMSYELYTHRRSSSVILARGGKLAGQFIVCALAVLLSLAAGLCALDVLWLPRAVQNDVRLVCGCGQICQCAQQVHGGAGFTEFEFAFAQWHGDYVEDGAPAGNHHRVRRSGTHCNTKRSTHMHIHM